MCERSSTEHGFALARDQSYWLVISRHGECDGPVHQGHPAPGRQEDLFRAVLAEGPVLRDGAPAGFTELRPNYAELTIKKRRGVQNHIGTVHVIAICNGLEAAMGALAEATVPSNKRWIQKGREGSYTAKATSNITCIAETDPEAWTGDNPDLPVRIRGVRDDGTVVVDGVIRLWVTEKPARNPA